MKVLVVEDEAVIANDIAIALRQAGYVVETCGDGKTAWFLGETEDFDAMVVDLGLPRLDGLALIRNLRDAKVNSAIIILTARGAWMERVEGIDAGADDYIVKPFHTEELLSRLAAVLRRVGGHASPVIRVGRLAIDTRRLIVHVDDRPLELSSLEFRLLRYLANNLGRNVTQSELREHVYGGDRDPDSNTMEVLVSRLRRKIGAEFIVTRRGHGYALANELGPAVG